MYCNYCGSNMEDDAAFCPNCGKKVERVQGMQNAGPTQNMGQAGSAQGVQGMTARRRGVDSVFAGVMYEKTTAAYLEFGIFAAVCVAAVLAFLAGVLIDGSGYISGNFRALWIFMMVFTIGYGVLVAFRQRILAILYGAAVFFFCLLIPYFSCERKVSDVFLSEWDKGTPISMWIFFTFMILAAVGLVACLAVHIFSKYFRLDNIILLLGSSLAVMVVVLGIFSYAAPRYSYKISYRESGWDAMLESRLVSIKELYASERNGLGTTAYAVISLANGAYMFLFFRGLIDNRKQKISLDRLMAQGGGAYGADTGWQGQNAVPVQPAAEPAIQFFTGVYAGRALRLQGEVIIGSEQGKAHVVLQDDHVSSQHCVIRYNRGTGNYEVRDLSTNGVFLENGARLQSGTYMACARGTVLYLGSRNQKIRLR